MNQPPNPELSPQDRALADAAQSDEVRALNEYLQGRVLSLNVEVRRRDARIAELEAAQAGTDADTPGPQPS